MKYVVAILILVASFRAFIYWPVRTSPSGEMSERHTQEQIKEFKRLLKKHGLHKQISVIFTEGKQQYFINERGVKCRFI